MRAKSAKRLQAEKLRRELGLSYSEIAAQTGINKSTLSSWLRDILLDDEQMNRLQQRLQATRAGFAARALPINRERYQRAREHAYESGVSAASALPSAQNVDELALAMLYLGEGSKRNSSVQLANTDPEVLRFFLWALRTLYGTEEQRITFRLNLVPAAQSSELTFRLWWGQELGCPADRFQKTQFDRRSRVTNLSSDYHGVCTISYADLYLQQRILGLARAFIHVRGRDLTKEK